MAVAPNAPLLARTGHYPPDVGSKFEADGRVRPFAGNTVVCHLPQQGEHAAAFDAMLDIYREAPSHRFMRKVALLPPSSYHMTVMGGANDKPRLQSSWPSDLPLDLPISDCNKILADRLRNYDPGLDLPIRMKIDPEQRPENGKALIFLLQPADDGEAAKLANLREQLANIFKIRPSNFGAYRFHISLGYSLRWFDAAEERERAQVWSRWANQIADKAPIISFGAPEYCTFKDMYAFHREFFLGKPA